MEQMAALNLPPEAAKEKVTAEQNVVFDYDDLLNGHIRQEVIISGKLKVVFQTLNGAESEWLLDESGTLTGKPMDYVSAWYRNSEMALGLLQVVLNGKELELPQVLFDTPQGAHFPVPTAEAVEKRRLTLMHALPNTIVARIQLHYSWFLERATKDLAGGALKNG